MTPQLIADIKAAVGDDVDTEGFAVFEVSALNDLPLVGKDGTLFEKAEISLLTLKQMADTINEGHHLPIILNHDMEILPLGRAFKASTYLRQDGSAELRLLFYLDATQADMASRIDAGSVDEVSVQFLATQLLCSECGFDYRGEEADWNNVVDRTCNNGHVIGTDGIHLRLVGLQVFTELSLVTRGAAKNPKIIGKSESKLATPLQALAARGFEIDKLLLTASKGENTVDLDSILTKLADQTTATATITAKLEAVTAERDAAVAERDTAQARVTELEAAPQPEDNEDLAAELEAAKTALIGIYTKLATAAGATEPAPESIADIQDGIEKFQSKLTALIPAGGSGANPNTSEGGSAFVSERASVFKSKTR